MEQGTIDTLSLDVLTTVYKEMPQHLKIALGTFKPLGTERQWVDMLTKYLHESIMATPMNQSTVNYPTDLSPYTEEFYQMVS